jgi:Family of unknown function (DUF6461)
LLDQVTLAGGSGAESTVMTHPLVAYYESVLHETGHIHDMCWAVVEGIDASVSIEEATRRLGADPDALTELPYDAKPDVPSWETLVYLAPHRSGVVLCERGSGLQSIRPEVIRWLSAGARVHSTTWHYTGGERLLYGAYGTLLTGLRPNWPRDRWGELPDALDDDLRAVGGFAASDPDLGPHPKAHPGAVAMAAIELRTGARATVEWLTGTRIAVPVTHPIPDDPQPTTALARMDADLDAWLRLASDQTRREAVRHTLNRVIERFDLSADPVVTLLRPAVDAGQPMAVGSEVDAVREVWRHLPDQYGVPLPKGQGFRRDARALVFYAVTPSPYSQQPLKVLCQAKALLEDDWPQLRTELLAIARSTLTNPSEHSQ